MNSRDLVVVVAGVMVRDMIEWMGFLEKEGSGYLGFPILPSRWTVVPVTGDEKS